MALRQHFFYNSMRKTIIQTLDLFNDIVIARYDKDTGDIIKYVKVPLKFAPKTKQWYWKEVRDGADRRDIVMPIMAMQLENVEYAVDRQVNKNHKISVTNDGSDVVQYLNPVPYDFTFQLQIAAEYMVDITQIVEQIFPFFTPEAYIRITLPELGIDGSAVEEGEAGADQMELMVTYEGSSKEAPVELDEANYRVLIWNLNFKVKGYVFKPVDTTKVVQSVVTNYYTTDEAWDNSSLDVDGTIGVIGHQSLQGVTTPQTIPTPPDPVDDSIRELFDYEHFEA